MMCQAETQDARSAYITRGFRLQTKSDISAQN